MPDCKFTQNEYYLNNPDVANAKMPAVDHWKNYGRNESRVICKRAPETSTSTPTPAPTQYTIVGCEADSASLACPDGTSIQSGYIRYGRWDNTVCPHPTVKNNGRDIAFPLPTNFIGQKSVTISDWNSLKGDPRRGVYKHFKVDYTCK
jgi:hypothetical protein